MWENEGVLARNVPCIFLRQPGFDRKSSKAGEGNLVCALRGVVLRRPSTEAVVGVTDRGGCKCDRKQNEN
jgi:hypothetical protein